MKRTYLLRGIDCPHCAQEIEDEVLKIKGVTAATVNIMKETLSLDYYENILTAPDEAVTNAVHKHEPDVDVSVKKAKRGRGDDLAYQHEHHKHSEHCSCEHEHHEHGEHCDCRHEHGEHCSCGHEHHEHGNYCDCEHEHHEHHEHKEASQEVVFCLENLDCAHCAAEIERELSKTDGIAYAEINLIGKQLRIGIEDSFDKNLFEIVKKTIKRIEPDADVAEEDHKKKQDEKKSLLKVLKSDKAMIVRLAAGAALYALGIVLHLFADIPMSVYLALLITAYVILGWDVVYSAVRNIFSGRIFDEKFLMTVSTVGAFAIGEYPEAAAVMLFYQVGEFFQELAVKRSRKSISELMDIRPDSAELIIGKTTKTVSPDEVSVGDLILIKPGEKIPLDGEIIEGESLIDTRALTGESVPRKVTAGDKVLSGCINETGAVKVKVEKEFGESTASKILELVENAAGRKAPTENFISVFARYYTPVVVGLAVMLAVIPPLVLHGGWSEWVRRCFVFLVISCPCALVISIPLTFFSGIGAASAKGILVKGSNYLEALSAVDTVVFDKTGTLTKGVFRVTELHPAVGVPENELISIAAAAERMSNHPIARSIAEAYSGKENISVKNYTEISGRGVSAECDGRKVLVGSHKLMTENGISCEKLNANGTIVYVAADDKYLGSIVISDELKEGSREVSAKLHEVGVSKTVMLTGDIMVTAKAVAEETGIDEYHAELLPDQKVERVEELFSSRTDENGKIAFVGDGINDAPVLARADVGVAMGALGSDAAIEAADVVLMNDDPCSLVDAIEIARYTKRKVTQNIVMVLAVKVIILALGAFGIAGMWTAVFGDVGIMIIAVINSRAARVAPGGNSHS